MNLVFTSDLLVKRIAQLLQPFDVTPASGLVLGMLADSETPLPPNVIADRLIITRATVTGLIDSLERRGYVRRQAHQTDRRMVLVEITDVGRRVAGEFRPLIHQNQKAWFSVLSDEAQMQLIDALHQLQGVLRETES